LTKRSLARTEERQKESKSGQSAHGTSAFVDSVISSLPSLRDSRWIRGKFRQTYKKTGVSAKSPFIALQTPFQFMFFRNNFDDYFRMIKCRPNVYFYRRFKKKITVAFTATFRKLTAFGKFGKLLCR